jgi:hypothetical protein
LRELGFLYFGEIPIANLFNPKDRIQEKPNINMHQFTASISGIDVNTDAQPNSALLRMLGIVKKRNT